MTAPIPREHFLPANSTKFETSLSESLARIQDVPVPIDTLWSWDKCPLSHLPWLAWALSVDFWNQDWPEHKKRLVCKEAFEVHSLKGTLAGVRKYLEYADAVLVDAILPPQEGFLGDFDEELTDFWRSQLPQIHIRPFVNNDNDYTFYLDDGFLDDGFIGENDIGQYVGRKAYYVHDGVETEIEWLTGAGPFAPDGVERFAIPTLKDDHTFYLDDGFLDSEFLTDADEIAAEIVGLNRAGLGNLLTAGYTVTDAEPEIVPLEYFAGEKELYLDDGFLDDGHLMGFEIQPEFYEKFYLYIPEKFPPAPPDPYAYLDHTRFGFDEFTAELKVQINDTTDDPHFFFLDEGFLDDGFVGEPDFKDLWQALDAIEMSKSLRDDVFVDTQVKRQVQFGDNVLLGDLVLGEFIEA